MDTGQSRKKGNVMHMYMQVYSYFTCIKQLLDNGATDLSQKPLLHNDEKEGKKRRNSPYKMMDTFFRDQATTLFYFLKNQFGGNHISTCLLSHFKMFQRASDYKPRLRLKIGTDTREEKDIYIIESFCHSNV